MDFRFWRKKDPAPVQQQRSFNAAKFSNTTDIGASLNINADLLGNLSTLRYRCRDMINNNGYASGLIETYKNNIVGPNGVRLSVQAKNYNNQLDTAGNNAIENAWASFSKYGQCTVEGHADLIKLQEIVMHAVAVDGESLILIHRGDEFGKHKIQFEVLSVDCLANYMTRLESGNLVYQGIEIDEYSKPVAYWLRRWDIADPAQRILMNGTQFTRVPAEDVIHLFDAKYPKQMRGIPWLANSILNLHHISQLQTAELTMARLAALKRVMFKVNPDEQYTVDPNNMDEFYNVNSTLDNASIEVLQPGMEPVSIEWSTPNSSIAEFTKTILRQVAAGTAVSYNSIAKDLESVTYSSARFGALEDRVNYVQRQRWFCNAFMDRIYTEWLSVQLMYNSIKLPNSQYSFGIDKLEKFSNVKWTCRGFQSVDPYKDSMANKLQLGCMTTTYSDICSQTGTSFEELLTQRVREELQIKQAYEAAGLEPPALDQFLYGVPPEQEGKELMKDGDEKTQARPPKVMKDK